MTVPVFEEYEPALDCACAGCAERRRDLARGLSVKAGGHPAAHGARRAMVLFTAAGVALGAPGVAGAADAVSAAGTTTAHAAGLPSGSLNGATAGAPAFGPDPTSPQGGSAPLYGRPLPGPGPSQPSGLRKSTRTEIINRAKRWVAEKVPYSMEKYWSDGYRQDCSGYVSMAWNLDGNEWTGSLDAFGVRIEREELEPGDMLLFHNPSNPEKGSHVTLFGGWTDSAHSHYVAYEQTKPHTRTQSTPMAYWNNSDRYVPYRYKGLIEETDGKGPDAEPGTGAAAAFPGAGFFGPGADNKYVTQLGEMLVKRGGKRFYGVGPGPRWTEADRLATEAFQLAQGWRGTDADGLPGPETWRYLVNGLGNDIPSLGTDGADSTSGGAGTGAGNAGSGGGAGTGAGSAGAGGSAGTSAGSVPAYPGAEHFRPGRSGAYVEQLGKQLVRKGFGKHYVSGPERHWTEADRRNVEAFQRAQGWRGTEADGYPGPQTWRRLFA
ncbi:peptidoglycan-binding protein [Streptomyces sp. NPDC088116]|uniref:peptidoglycan-binding protein n=1 Tax=Streptomyces sp. NPDC088116 TaxID=3365825 RepID=UPI0037FE0C98